MSSVTNYDVTRKLPTDKIDMAVVESANIAFRNEYNLARITPTYSVAKNGKDVVAKFSPVKYYVTVTINQRYVIEGANEKVKDGVYDENNYVPENGRMDILSKVKDAKYVDKNDPTAEISVEDYDALTETQKQDYEFNGTLTLTLRTNALHNAWNSTYFTTDTLYQLNELVPSDGTGTRNVAFGLSASELEAATTAQGFGAFYDQAVLAAEGRQNENLVFKNAHIYQVIGNQAPVEITAAYINHAKAHEDYNTESEYNAALLGVANGQTLTFANYAINSNVKINDSDDNEGLYLADLTKPGATSYKGSIMNEKVTSTANKETFDLGKGHDKITFNGAFGNDIIKTSANETLNLDIKDNLGFAIGPTEIKWTASGNDIKGMVSSTYALKVTVAEGAKVDGYSIAAGEYTMYLAKSGSQGSSPNKYMFQLTPNYNGADAEEKHYLYYHVDVGDITVTNPGENATYSINNDHWSPNANTDVTLTNFRLVRIGANGNETDYLAQYYAMLMANGSDAYTVGQLLYNAQNTTSSFTIKNFDEAARKAADIEISGVANGVFSRTPDGMITYTSPELAKLFTKDDSDIKNGKITLKGTKNNIVNVSEYLSPDGKGVKITTGKGNDIIIGSLYNDTVKSMGGYNTIMEDGGTNKITLGKGGSHSALSGYSSNTLKAKGGKNTVYIDSVGLNKVTLGKGNDALYIDGGVNTIKAGAGANEFNVTGGNSKLFGGKNKDTFNLFGGYNVADGGKGNDVFNVSGGDEYTGYTGIHILKGNKGNDKYNFDSTGTAGDDRDNFIVSAIDSKGNDTYNFASYGFDGADRVIVTDKKGTNTIVLTDSGTSGLRDDYEVYFNVSIKTKKGKTIKTIGKTLVINQDIDETGGSVGNKETGVIFNYDGKLSRAGLTKNLLATSDSTVAGKNLNIGQIAATVASWLKANGYKSADSVMYGSDTTARNELAKIYAGADNVCMKDGTTAFADYRAINVFSSAM